MGTLMSIVDSCSNNAYSPYSAEQVNAMLIDFILGQLPEQNRPEEDDYGCGFVADPHSADLFLQIFGQPTVMNSFGDNYLFYYALKDHMTLVVTIDGFAYDMNRIHIQDYAVY